MKHNASAYRNRRCHDGPGGQACDICRDDHRILQHEANQTRKARLEADPTLAVHGRWSTYCNWYCRCPPCRQANIAKMAAYNERRRRAQTPFRTT